MTRAGLRRDLRLRHARPDHPAEPGPDPARRHHGRIRGHPVRGRVIPGLMLAAIYCVYLVVLGIFRPDGCRRSSRRARGRRAASSGKGAAQVVPPPSLLMLAVLGSIIGGVAAPTEAASMGALGSIPSPRCRAGCSLKMLRETVGSPRASPRR